jgi:hypothetical protein
MVKVCFEEEEADEDRDDDDEEIKASEYCIVSLSISASVDGVTVIPRVYKINKVVDNVK